MCWWCCFRMTLVKGLGGVYLLWPHFWTLWISRKPCPLAAVWNVWLLTKQPSFERISFRCESHLAWNLSAQWISQALRSTTVAFLFRRRPNRVERTVFKMDVHVSLEERGEKYKKEKDLKHVWTKSRTIPPEMWKHTRTACVHTRGFFFASLSSDCCGVDDLSALLQSASKGCLAPDWRTLVCLPKIHLNLSQKKKKKYSLAKSVSLPVFT